jgi:hypothetical protein
VGNCSVATDAAGSIADLGELVMERIILGCHHGGRLCMQGRHHSSIAGAEKDTSL